jgi:hypothetical protein
MPWTAVMDKWKSGKLKSGGSGKPVHDQKQAIAIMLSEKRQAKTKPEYRAKFSHGGKRGV